MLFADGKHKSFVLQSLKKCGDSYMDNTEYQSLFYALGITEDCRNHIDELFDFEKRLVIWDGLEKPWVTGADARVIRLAFSLFTGTVYELEIMEKEGASKEDIIKTASLYSPVKIFSYGGDISLLMLHAVMLRFGLSVL